MLSVRINSLLLADELRVKVAREIGLGQASLTPGKGEGGPFVTCNVYVNNGR